MNRTTAASHAAIASSASGKDLRTSAQSSNDTNRPGLPHSRCVSSAEADVDWALTSTAAFGRLNPFD